MGRIVSTGVAAAIIGVLALVAAVTVTFIPGVAALYPATAFEAAFGVWLGYRGGIAAYIGLLFAGLLAGWFNLPTGVLLSVSDALIAFAGTLAVRYLGLRPSLPRLHDAAVFVGAALTGSVLGSLWYNLINLGLGVIAGWGTFWLAILGWNLGNLIILIVVGVPLMRFATPVLEKLNVVEPGGKE